MQWQLSDFIFLFVAVFTIGHAVVVVINKNLVRAAFALLFSFLGVAGLYVFAGADFLAAIQVMVYVGGISILFLFAIMLTAQITRVEEAGELIRKPLGILICLAVGGVILTLIFSTWSLTTGSYEATTATIGNALLGDYLLPFEIISVLLIMALIGAVMLARSEFIKNMECIPADQDEIVEEEEGEQS